MDGGGQSPGARRAPQNLELSPTDHTLGVGTLWELSASLAPPRPLSLTVSVWTETLSLVGMEGGGIHSSLAGLTHSVAVLSPSQGGG